MKLSTEESFRITYFIYLVDHVISSLQSRFEQFEIYIFQIKVNKYLFAFNNVTKKIK
ncbi:uncharacterized protein LOC116118745 [Pistacia vera]|uniref:uncharacterized protein LOC116118745 n=1 Tax=Pistacia vera TaxID=55513 RepID=UPI001262DC02|nr:uncharacterized protein LOC116118745 [Pistacia vera]